MPQNPALAALMGQRRRLGQMGTEQSPLGIGQIYEDPSVTSHGLMKSREQELQQDLANSSEPFDVNRISKLLGNIQEDIGETESYMDNPEMRARHGLDVQAQAAGFPDSAAAASYQRDIDAEKMRHPMDIADRNYERAVEVETRRGRSARDVADINNRARAERDREFLQRLGSLGNEGAPIAGVRAGGSSSGPAVTYQRQPQIPQPKPDQILGAIRNELALMEAGDPNRPGSSQALTAAVGQYMSNFTDFDPQTQQTVLGYLSDPDYANDPSESFFDSIDDSDVELLNFLRTVRGK